MKTLKASKIIQQFRFLFDDNHSFCSPGKQFRVTVTWRDDIHYISVSGDLSQCQLGSRWRTGLLTDFIRDLFVAIQMTEFLHNNHDCHSSRDMIHPTVGIIVYSKIVQSHHAWRPSCVCLDCTRHIRSWMKPLCWVFIRLCWEPRDAWLVVLSITCRGRGHQPAARVVNLNTEMRWWAEWAHTPHMLHHLYLDRLANSSRLSRPHIIMPPSL